MYKKCSLYCPLKKVLLAVVPLVVLCTQGIAATPRTFSFTLSGNSKTSGGVFDSGGRLVKTLWSGKNHAAGTYYVAWDGNYDNHAGVVAPAPEATYTLKVLANNVQYTWEGVVGNTSSSFTSYNIWKALFGPIEIAINADGVGVMATGFCEGQPNARRFHTRDPNTPSPVPDSRDGFTAWSHVAIDGSKYYLSIKGSAWDPQSSNFIIARNISDDSTYVFPSGVNAGVGQGASAKTYVGVIDATQQGGGFDEAFASLHNVSGLAVQQSGNVLAAAHAPLNKVDLYDKNSGAGLGQITIAGPKGLSFASNGDLFVISGSSVMRFAAGTLGQTNTPVSTISNGLVNPTAVAASLTDSDDVLVMDAGTSQVKAFVYTSSWGLTGTLGQAGGYNAANGPDVTEDAATVKFSFGSPILSLQADGSFWVGDYGCNRILHYSANLTYLGQIAFVSSSGPVVADPNDPGRLFSNGTLEYEIDYTKPSLPGDPGSNGGWKLVKNWRAGFDPFYKGFTSVVTLSGRTYATSQGGDYQMRIVELPGNGPVRIIGPAPGGYTLHRDGNIMENGGVDGKGNLILKKYPGTGFATGTPTWSGSVVIASAPCNTVDFNHSYDPNPFLGSPVTTPSGDVVVFNGNGTWDTVDIPGAYRLGLIPANGTDWKWRASPGKPLAGPDGMGTYSTTGVFGGLGAVGMFVEGSDIIWGVNGQYAPFSNQFGHFSDNGLFVGQFGVPRGDETTPGFAGNFLGMTMVKAAGKIYVYTSDESGHAGIARWCVSGLETIRNITGAVSSFPGDPGNLVVEPATSTQMSLTWSDNSNNETGFRIERATDSDFTRNFTKVTTTAANVTRFTDNGLNVFRNYYYRVKATNASGDSNQTNIAFNQPADKLTGTLIAHDGGYPDSQPAYAFDGNFKTHFSPTGYVQGAGWVGYDLGSPRTLSKIKYAPKPDNDLQGVFQASNTADFSSGVVELGRPQRHAPPLQFTDLILPQCVAGYRYVRFYGDNLGWPRIAEIQFWGSNVSPTVSLTAPTANQVYPTVPATINLAATASVAGGTIAKVEFYIGPVLLNTDTSAPFSFSWPKAPAGWYQLTAKAYDHNNVAVESSKVPVTVGAATIPNLIGFWKLDEGGGLTTADGTLNNRPGTLEGGPIWSAGKFGHALTFDGADDDVVIPSTFGLGNADLTIACWVNLATTSRSGLFVKLGTGAGGFGLGVGHTTAGDPGNNLILLFESVRWIDTGIPIGTGWHHVAMTIFPTGVAQGYLDGNPVNTPVGGNALAPVGQTSIGGQSGGGRNFNGIIDDVRVYSRALTGAEIQAVKTAAN